MHITALGYPGLSSQCPNSPLSLGLSPTHALIIPWQSTSVYLQASIFSLLILQEEITTFGKTPKTCSLFGWDRRRNFYSVMVPQTQAVKFYFFLLYKPMPCYLISISSASYVMKNTIKNYKEYFILLRRHYRGKHQN